MDPKFNILPEKPSNEPIKKFLAGHLKVLGLILLFSLINITMTLRLGKKILHRKIQSFLDCALRPIKSAPVAHCNRRLLSCFYWKMLLQRSTSLNKSASFSFTVQYPKQLYYFSTLELNKTSYFLIEC